jgi:hypothetical protein
MITQVASSDPVILLRNAPADGAKRGLSPNGERMDLGRVAAIDIAPASDAITLKSDNREIDTSLQMSTCAARGEW